MSALARPQSGTARPTHSRGRISQPPHSPRTVVASQGRGKK